MPMLEYSMDELPTLKVEDADPVRLLATAKSFMREFEDCAEENEQLRKHNDDLEAERYWLRTEVERLRSAKLARFSDARKAAALWLRDSPPLGDSLYWTQSGAAAFAMAYAERELAPLRKLAEAVKRYLDGEDEDARAMEAELGVDLPRDQRASAPMRAALAEWEASRGE